MAANQPRGPHLRTSHSYERAEALSSDSSGPMPEVGIGGERHFVTFIDVATRFAAAIPIVSRSEIPELIDVTFNNFIRDYGKAPRIFVSDNAREYVSARVKETLDNYGCKSVLMSTYSPEENGIAEGLNRTLLEAVRAALHTVKMSERHWPLALQDAVFKYNLREHSSTGQIPLNEWLGVNETPKRLFAFGQMGSVHRHSPQKRKLENSGQWVRYVYPVDRKRIMTMNEYGTFRIVRIKNFHPYQSNRDPNAISKAVFNFNSTLNNAFKARRWHPVPTVITPTTLPPSNLTQAIKYPDNQDWAKSHDAELDKIDEMKTIHWLSPDFSPASKPLPITMTYRYKWSTGMQLLRRKSSAALRGDVMIPFVHYDPAHLAAPMASTSTVRLLFAIKAKLRLLILEHFDITSAFLHEAFGYSNTVYVREMRRSNGTFHHGNTVGILNGNMYGGRSDGNYFMKGLISWLQHKGYQPIDFDPCLYYKKNGDDFILFSVCIDDFLVVCTSKSLSDTLFNDLCEKYSIKRLGTPDRYLGLSVNCESDGSIIINQPHEVDALLKESAMQQCNPVKAPFPMNANCNPPTEEDTLCPQFQPEYQARVGHIRYIADCTGPDLSYAASVLGAALHSPTERHKQLLSSVIRYIKGTREPGIKFTSCPSPNESLGDFALEFEGRALKAFSDADFGNDLFQSRSTSGAVITYNGSPIAWFARRQRLVALSTAEAQYIAMTEAMRLATSIAANLREMGLITDQPVPFFLDNEPAVKMINAISGTRLRKTIRIRHHLIQQEMSEALVEVSHIPTSLQKADIMTKPLSRVAFLRGRSLLSMEAPQFHS